MSTVVHAGDTYWCQGNGAYVSATEPEEGEQKPWCPDSELPLEGDAMTAHLLDAHEEAGQPGTVYLFCKVQAALLSAPACSAWQPCSLHSPLGP